MTTLVLLLGLFLAIGYGLTLLTWAYDRAGGK